MKKRNGENIYCATFAGQNINFDGEKFEHTLLIVEIENKLSLSKIKIASHTIDNYGKAISEYYFKKIRWIHIQGMRRY